MREGKELDSIDIKLLKILEEDSRTPWSRIARRLGVSEATVYLRVKKLMEMGVLEGFTAKINIARLGLTSTAYLMLKVGSSSLEGFRKVVTGNPHVVEAYEVFAGEYNVLVKLIAGSQEELAEEVDRILSIPGVQGAFTIYNMRTIKSKPVTLEVFMK